MKRYIDSAYKDKVRKKRLINGGIMMKKHMEISRMGAALLLSCGICMEADALSPGSVPASIVDVRAKSGDQQISLTWRVLKDGTANGIKVFRLADDISVTEITYLEFGLPDLDGRVWATLVYDGLGTKYTDTNLTNGVKYRYAIASYYEFRAEEWGTWRNVNQDFYSPLRFASATPKEKYKGDVCNINGTNCMVIVFPPIPGSMQVVQRADRLGGEFSAIANLVFPANSYTDAIPDTVTSAFYRIEEVQTTENE